MVIFVVHPLGPSDPLSTLTEASIVAIIPSRYASSRLPGKPLLDIAGQPMIEHVYRRVAATSSIDAVIVATDDERIRATVVAFGGHACVTRATHRAGTDRVAEVAEHLPCDIVVNVQGDEPLIEPAMIEQAIAPLVADRAVVMSTIRRRIDDPAELDDPNVVKVVTDQHGDALYFSRTCVPCVRAPRPATPPAIYKHIGLYVYRRSVLLELTRLEPMPLECAESLEQLRALEHGYRIRTVDTTFDSLAVDTPEDLERVRVLMTTRSRA